MPEGICLVVAADETRLEPELVKEGLFGLSKWPEIDDSALRSSVTWVDFKSRESGNVLFASAKRADQLIHVQCLEEGTVQTLLPVAIVTTLVLLVPATRLPVTNTCLQCRACSRCRPSCRGGDACSKHVPICHHHGCLSQASFQLSRVKPLGGSCLAHGPDDDTPTPLTFCSVAGPGNNAPVPLTVCSLSSVTTCLKLH